MNISNELVEFGKFYCPLNNSSGAREGRAGAVRAVKAKARQAAGTGTDS